MSLPFAVRLHKGDEIKTVEVDVDDDPARFAVTMWARCTHARRLTK